MRLTQFEIAVMVKSMLGEIELSMKSQNVLLRVLSGTVTGWDVCVCELYEKVKRVDLLHQITGTWELSDDLIVDYLLFCGDDYETFRKEVGL
jgi:hypothetical protein